MSGCPQIAIVSLGTTPGLRRADAALAQGIRDAGGECSLVPVRVGTAAGRLRRHPALTDLVEALAARRAAQGAQAEVFVFSTVTAALLARPGVPYAVRFDSPAALNRPGPGGLWQRRRERAVMAGARLMLPWGAIAARHAPVTPTPSVTLPVPVDEVEPAARRDLDAVAYAGYPHKRGLDLLCRAWTLAGVGGGLTIGGVDADRGRRFLSERGVPEPAGVEWVGPLEREVWLALVARARTFVNASRWEDHGLSQLEALSAGTPLVTVPSPGAYEGLPLARRLAPPLVAADMSPEALAAALGSGLALDAGELEAYGRAARELLAPLRPAAVQERLATEVLPALRAQRA